MLWSAVGVVSVVIFVTGCSDRNATHRHPTGILSLDTSDCVVIESSEAAALYGVADATVLDDGTVVVGNSGNTEVLLFSSTGTHLRSFGRRGSGPGEFSAVGSVFPHIGDSIAVSDGFQRRLSIFDSDGNLGRTVNLAQLADFASVVGLLGDRFVYRTPVRNTIPRDSVRIWISSSQDPLTTIPNRPNRMVSWETGQGVVTSPHPLAFSPEAMVAAGYGMIVAGVSDVPEIQMWDPNGIATRAVYLDLPQRSVTDAEIEQYMERRRSTLLSMRRSTASRQRELRILEQVEFPDHYPLFDRLLAAASGEVWVRAYVTRQDTIATWHLFRSNGDPKGQLMMPSDWSLLHAGHQFLIIKALDNLDVEYLQIVKVIDAA